MGRPMPIVDVQLDCGHVKKMAEWLTGDRRIQCDNCSRIWVMTAVKAHTTAYQTKTEIKPPTTEGEDDETSQANTSRL